METTNLPDFDILSAVDYEHLFDLVSVDNNNADEMVSQFHVTYENMENILSGSSFEDENQVVFPGQECLPDFDFYFSSILDPDFVLNEVPGGENSVVWEEGNGNDGDEYTDTPTTPMPFQSKRSTKSDRSRIINSERKRRGTMKEKLYQLRALVPNITKMDRASIIADAVKYVHDLQMKAKALKNEIESMESSERGDNHQQQPIHYSNQSELSESSITKKIMQLEVVKIEGAEFHVRLVCKQGYGVAASLMKGLEFLSLPGITLQSSNIASAEENYVLRFTIKASESIVGFNLSNMKSLIVTAFSSEGFDIEKSSSTEAAPCSD